MRPFMYFLSIVSLLFALAACGTKGPLYLPPADNSTASGAAR